MATRKNTKNNKLSLFGEGVEKLSYVGENTLNSLVEEINNRYTSLSYLNKYANLSENVLTLGDEQISIMEAPDDPKEGEILTYTDNDLAWKKPQLVELEDKSTHVTIKVTNDNETISKDVLTESSLNGYVKSNDIVSKDKDGLVSKDIAEISFLTGINMSSDKGYITIYCNTSYLGGTSDNDKSINLVPVAPNSGVGLMSGEDKAKLDDLSEWYGTYDEYQALLNTGQIDENTKYYIYED